MVSIETFKLTSVWERKIFERLWYN